MLKVNDYGLAPVTFLKDVDIYLPGMTAGFPLAISKRLVDEGKAVPYVAPEKTEEAPALTIDQSRLVASLDAGQVEGSIGMKSKPFVRSHAVAAAVKEQEVATAAQVREDAAAEAQAKREAAATESGEESGSKVMGADDEVVIPDDWKTLHHTQRKKIAREITGQDAESTEAADATIEQALAARASSAGDDGEE